MTCDTMVFQLDIMPRICESFQACVCLEFLDLKLNHLSHEPLVPSQIPVVLPQLVQFSLYADTPDIIGSFMYMFDMPCLDHLKLRTGGYVTLNNPPYPYEQTITSILNFLDRNGNQIDRLWLDLYALLDMDLVRILQRVPNIDALDIQDKDVTLLMWNALTIHYDSQGRIQAGQNLRLTDICCVPPSRELDGCDYTGVFPCLPLLVDAPLGAAGWLGIPGTAPSQITFAGDPLPAEDIVYQDMMY